MRSVLLILFVFAFSISSNSQIKTLSNLLELKDSYENLKKNKDTFLIRGIYYSSGKNNKQNIINNLHQRGEINKNNFRTSISISLFDAEDKYYLPIYDKDLKVDKELININNSGKQVLLEIIIIKSNKYYKGNYFFIVNKIKFADQN